MKKPIQYLSVSLALLVVLPLTLRSQTKSSELIKPEVISGVAYVDTSQSEQLVTTIREATKQYHDYRKAQAAGYKPLGPDMPNMGNHWINTSLAVSRTLDFEKPSTLTYLKVDGEWRLTGVAYTQPVKPEETPTPLPLENMKWHFHSGSLKKEAHGIHLENSQEDGRQETKLAMIHAWVWSNNPDGLFAADNWALSYQRFGIQVPPSPVPDISKALYLASAGTDYFLRFVELCLEPKKINKAKLEAVMQQAYVKLNQLLTSYSKGEKLSRKDEQRIESIWNSMWDEVKNLAGEQHWPSIAMHLHATDLHR